ncbi:hypothetical protein [Cryptosporangium phraense]|uniref:Uncharacterized protein n=1 Tax=Cryptosporangium phraense TaxID=2593070 RepID=A0A545AVT6_9ACTN|nr:hypothetical protein [Cryptosporangium phraense]TQS45424.1 hypothetical protein FL583_10105 [Cryptosporangium phraense]
MSLWSASVVTVLGSVCAGGTLWWARRAERAAEAPSPLEPAKPAVASPWWEGTSWWPSLSEEERQWVVQNLADADRE